MCLNVCLHIEHFRIPCLQAKCPATLLVDLAILWTLVKCLARLLLLAKPRLHTVHLYSDYLADFFHVLLPVVFFS